MLKRVEFKLPGARKVRSFIVYPETGAGHIMIQCGDAIAAFNPVTGEGKYAVNAGGAYGPHLAMKGKPITFPPEFVAECIAAHDQDTPRKHKTLRTHRRGK